MMEVLHPVTPQSNSCIALNLGKMLKFLSTYKISICKKLVLTLIQYGNSLPFNSGVWKTFGQSEY